MANESEPVKDGEPSPGEPVFHFKKKIDDDWKKKVEEEKERLSDSPPRSDPRRERKQPEAPQRKGAPAEEPPSAPEEEDDRAAAAAAGASPFLRFVGDLANQALTALGVYPDPLTRTRQVSLEQARYIIDVLRILKDKTKGNLTADEQRVLDGLLYELQVQFVEMNR